MFVVCILNSRLWLFLRSHGVRFMYNSCFLFFPNTCGVVLFSISTRSSRLDLPLFLFPDLGNVQHALQLVSRFDSEGPSYFGGTDLGLRGNPWKMPPEAVVEQGLEAIKIFLGDVLDANKDNDHVRSLQLLKVVLVGSPSAGKTR